MKEGTSFMNSQSFERKIRRNMRSKTTIKDGKNGLLTKRICVKTHIKWNWWGGGGDSLGGIFQEVEVTAAVI